MTLEFTIHDSQTFEGKPIKEGVFSRDMDEEIEGDRITEDLEQGIIDLPTAILAAIELERKNPTLENSSLLGNLFWKADMIDEATGVYTEAYTQASKLIPKGFRGRIDWLHLDNRPFLRVAHGYLLGLMHHQQGRKAKTLAKKLLQWCPNDNLGVRFLMPDIDFLNGDTAAALASYLKEAEASPVLWYPAALCALRAGMFVEACTYLRRGIIGNPYVAEGLTGRTELEDHLYWHGTNLAGTDFAIDYLESPVNVWTMEEIDFVDWVFNSSDVLRERAEMAALREALTYEHDSKVRRQWGERMDALIANIDSTLSQQMVRKVTNLWGESVWPWDRAGFAMPAAQRKIYEGGNLH